MQITVEKILIWLPSPMGDAILCTPALKAIRKYFKSSQIFFLARPAVREVLSPTALNVQWLEQKNGNPLAVAKMLRRYEFTYAILFKNSFASALAAFLAAIPHRIGYAREGRGFLLTDKLYPPKLSNGTFEPIPMLDYYLAIASRLGCDVPDRTLELLTDPAMDEAIRVKFPEIIASKDPIVVLVPGGAFGPSKCWPPENFAATADWLISNCKAKIVISVSPDAVEKKIAAKIRDSSKHQIINLAETPVNLGELKSLFKIADLVISNDTGPRHIAIALKRKLITLFGPNDPVWTDTGYENEIKIVGKAPCSPCGRPECKKSELLCMQAITVEQVCESAQKLLQGDKTTVRKPEFIKISESVFTDKNYENVLKKLDLTSIDNIFAFCAGSNLTKNNLAPYRNRLRFEAGIHPATMFLKRYDRPPITAQIKNWLHGRKIESYGLREFYCSKKLSAAGINTPKTIAYGEQWGIFFEKKSFIITEKIPNAESLERKLPQYFNGAVTAENLKLRRNFIVHLAAFIKKFHQTGHRHCDLYFSHIFYSDDGNFYLIDLARVFKPAVFAERFRVKDIAQIHYSATAGHFSKTDRLRFYFAMTERKHLTKKDKIFIRKVIGKAKRMSRHDLKHGRTIPYTKPVP
jgi:heptosyltransferase-2